MDFIDSIALDFDDFFWADIFVLGYYLLIAVVLVTAIVFAVQTFRGRISWGQARVMGVRGRGFLTTHLGRERALDAYERVLSLAAQRARAVRAESASPTRTRRLGR